MSPPCEAFLTADQLDRVEPFYPLHVRVCDQCLLVQLPAYVEPEDIFTEYAYFSSYSDAWVDHARRFVDGAIERFGLGSESLVVELASNDGYLLQHAVARGIPVLGIEPAKNVADAAIDRGVDTLIDFFGADLARELAADGTRADLVVANNVLAQVPDLNSFVEGIRLLLEPDGVVSIEFPHLLNLFEENQFDTIYHEHFSYFSLFTASTILRAHGLHVFDVDELWTHGGSLRLYAQHADTGPRATTAAVDALVEREMAAGLGDPEGHRGFGARVEHTRRRLLSHLIAARDEGRRVVGYGAPGKGNTLLNYCGIRSDLLEFTVDRNPYKHGRFLPGTHIPIHPVERLWDERPDEILVLPWNLRDEIAAQLAGAGAWGARLIIPIPDVEVIELTPPAPPDDPASHDPNERRTA
jgi:SAM-dependent methyltransferase